MGNRGGEAQLEFFVEDFLKQNAFDEAVKDVDGVVHLASPVQGGSAAPGEEDGASVDVDGEYLFIRGFYRFSVCFNP